MSKSFEEFSNMREQKQQIKGNQDLIDEDDIIAETLNYAKTKSEQNSVMRYRKFKQVMSVIDPQFLHLILKNPFSNVVMSGKLAKKSVGLIERWQDRFVVLTNAGMIQFKVEHAQKAEFEEPTKFKEI